MSSPKLSGFPVTFEAEEESDGVRIQPDIGVVMATPFNQVENGDSNLNFSLQDSNSDPGFEFMDLEPDLHDCIVYRERRSDFYSRTNQRPNSPSDFNIRGSEERLGIGSGSGSGQPQSDSVGAGLNFDWDQFSFTPDEEQELQDWEDFQNDIVWVQESAQVSNFRLEEEEELSVDHHEIHWQVVYSDDDVSLLEESEDLISLYDDIESATIVSPQASEDLLPIVEITSQELRKGNIVCAICIDDIVIGDKVRKLTCKHYYHGECIMHWLKIRKICPVCRYELPTYDLGNERNQRSLWYDFDGSLELMFE